MSSSISATPRRPACEKAEHERASGGDALGAAGQELQRVIASTDAAFRQDEHVVSHGVHHLGQDFHGMAPTRARARPRVW